MTPQATITTEALLRAAADHGVTVSRDQLKRLVRCGLMPRPRQRHCAGAAGSVGTFPAWSLEQLVNVHVVTGHRRVLADRILLAWWADLWVDPNRLRDVLAQSLEAFARRAAAERDRHEDATAAAEAMAAELLRPGSKSALAVGVRRRLGRDRDVLRTALTALGTLLFGGEPAWDIADDDEPTPAELVARGLGVEAAQCESPAGGGPWIEADFDVARFLDELASSGAFALDDFAGPIRSAPFAALCQARNDARVLATAFPPVADLLERVWGYDIAGLGWGGAVADPARGRLDMAAATRTWLLARSHFGDETVDSCLALLAEAREPAERLAALLDEDPAALANLRAALEVVAAG